MAYVVEREIGTRQWKWLLPLPSPAMAKRRVGTKSKTAVYNVTQDAPAEDPPIGAWEDLSCCCGDGGRERRYGYPARLSGRQADAQRNKYRHWHVFGEERRAGGWREGEHAGTGSCEGRGG